jgi:hypothetical protein
VLEPFSGRGFRGLFSDKPNVSNASDGFSAGINEDSTLFNLTQFVRMKI